MKLLKYLKGKKTFLVAGVAFALGGLEALNALGYGSFAVPNEVYVLLSAVGLYTLRDAIK